MSATRRRYRQQCSLALALDAVGERWTMLIVRNLLLGPLRYKDLLEGLEGIGSNLLSARLHHLEDIGLVERSTLPPPAGSKVYQLTDIGRELEPAISALAMWGSRLFENVQDDDRASAPWAVQGMAFMANTSLIADVDDFYEFRLDGQYFHIRVEQGTVRAVRGPAHRADVVVEMSVASLTALTNGDVTLSAGHADDSMLVEGDESALERCSEVLHLPWLAATEKVSVET